MTTTVTPIYQLKEVMFGQAFDVQQIVGATPLYDLKSSLNVKYNVFPTTVPPNPGALNYFGIGIGGRRNVSSQNLTEPQPILTTNMDLYQPIPIRMVPVSQDLSSSEQSQYRIRYIKTVNGQQYVCYMLKVLTKDNSQVQFTIKDSQGNLQPYVPDYSNLSPTPPTPSTDGTITSVGAEINVELEMTLTVTGQEISEAISILYNGDARYATISEIGYYTGCDQIESYTNYQGQSQNYTEALNAHLHTQYTFNGFDLSTPSSSFVQSIDVSSGRVVLLGS